MNEFHVVSWNVASWATTIERLKVRHGSFANFMLKHQIDILCIQEVKISLSELSLRGREYGLSDEYDIFWCYPRSNQKNSQGNGLNGVATFAKKGLSQSATANPFCQSILDNEGRCLMTDHGSFVIFNIYVPNSGSEYKRYCFKMKFLRALRASVMIQQDAGKHVLIVGDFNIAPRTADVCRLNRKINVQHCLRFNMSLLQHNRENSTEDSHNLQSDSIKLFCPSINRFLNEREQSMIRLAVSYLQRVWPDVSYALRNSLAVSQENGRLRTTAVRVQDTKKVSTCTQLFISFSVNLMVSR